MRRLASLAALLVLLLLAPTARADDGSGVPGAFAPFEQLIGAWKGAGIPTANRVKGWTESHAWAWVFDEGRPVGLSVEMTGDRTLARGRLTFDPVNGDYRLSGTDPKGEPVAFAGKLDASGQVLTLERQDELAGGVRQRLTLRLNSNKIRYVVWDDRREPGAPRYARFIEVNQGKVGEAFAAGGSASNLPKCVLTGGAATMSVSYGGRSYPVCCTGCRDEFESDPEKYAKKAAQRAASAETPARPADAVGKDDGSFDALLGGSDEPEEPAGGKAAALLERARRLEEDGKTRAAATYYRMVVKDFPRSDEAKAAGERLRALGEE